MFNEPTLENIQESLQSLRIIEGNITKDIEANPSDFSLKSHLEGIQKIIKEREQQVAQLKDR